MVNDTIMSAGERAAFANGYDARQREVDSKLQEVLDGMRIMMLMLQRLENTVTGQQNHLTAFHQWMAGMSDRIRKLEEGGV